MPERIPHLSKKDRERILARDGYTSALQSYSEARGFYSTGENGCPYDGQPCSSLQVHHIKPVRWTLFHGWTEKETNSEDNVITLFECQHVGRCKDQRIR
jgi:hypothetical protein